MEPLFEGMNNRLDDLQGQLKVSLERQEHLMRYVEKATANHKAEVVQLQHSLDEAKSEKWK